MGEVGMVQNNASMLRKVRHKIAARETPYQIVVYFWYLLVATYPHLIKNTFTKCKS
jgi:hypothetical protein